MRKLGGGTWALLQRVCKQEALDERGRERKKANSPVIHPFSTPGQGKWRKGTKTEEGEGRQKRARTMNG